MSDIERYRWVRRILVGVFGSVFALVGVAGGVVATTDVRQSPDPVLVLAMVSVFTTTVVVAGLVFVVYLYHTQMREMQYMIAEMDAPTEGRHD